MGHVLDGSRGPHRNVHSAVNQHWSARQPQALPLPVLETEGQESWSGCHLFQPTLPSPPCCVQGSWLLMAVALELPCLANGGSIRCQRPRAKARELPLLSPCLSPTDLNPQLLLGSVLSTATSTLPCPSRPQSPGASIALAGEYNGFSLVSFQLSLPQLFSQD